VFWVERHGHRSDQAQGDESSDLNQKSGTRGSGGDKQVAQRWELHGGTSSLRAPHVNSLMLKEFRFPKTKTRQSTPAGVSATPCAPICKTWQAVVARGSCQRKARGQWTFYKREEERIARLKATVLARFS